MKIWSSEHIFNHPWETVVSAAWRKYPNPINPSVTGVDTVHRGVDKSGQLTSHRVLTTEWGFPDWIIKFIGMPNGCYVSEHSSVNPADRIMTMRSRNLTLCNFVTIEEQLMYTPHASDIHSTVLRSETIVKVQGLPMTSYLESCIKGTMASKANQGRQAMEWVISRLKEETQDINDGIKNLTTSFTTSSSL